jgi:hypothetical protein
LAHAKTNDSSTETVERLVINGKCHCGNISFALDWPGGPGDVAARICSCTFCTKHGGVWTSNPEAKLAVAFRQSTAVSKYSFGTATAIFHICLSCGVVPIVTSEIADRLYAVVNVNTFENFDLAGLNRQAASFDGEEPQPRLARRQRNWIPDVLIRAGSLEP